MHCTWFNEKKKFISPIYIFCGFFFSSNTSPHLLSPSSPLACPSQRHLGKERPCLANQTEKSLHFDRASRPAHPAPHPPALLPTPPPPRLPRDPLSPASQSRSSPRAARGWGRAFAQLPTKATPGASHLVASS